MPHLIDLIDAAIYLTPVVAAAVGLGWFMLGLLTPRGAR